MKVTKENEPSGVWIPRVLFMVHNSAKFGEEYLRDFQASDRKGLQALSVPVGSYHTVTQMNGITL